jgi:hypothetical protein
MPVLSGWPPRRAAMTMGIGGNIGVIKFRDDNCDSWTYPKQFA